MSPHLLWHVHALDAVPVDVVVERGVLGAVLGPLPLRCATQHLLTFPLPCSTTRPPQHSQAPQKRQQSLRQATENKATLQLQLCACFCKPVFAEVKSGLDLINRPVVTSQLKYLHKVFGILLLPINMILDKDKINSALGGERNSTVQYC